MARNDAETVRTGARGGRKGAASRSIGATRRVDVSGVPIPRRVHVRAPPRTVVQDVRLDARLPRAPAQVHERPESRLLGRRGAAAAEAAIVLAHEDAHCDCLGRPDDARGARRRLARVGRRERTVRATFRVSEDASGTFVCASKPRTRAAVCAEQKAGCHFPAPAAGDIPKRRYGRFSDALAFVFSRVKKPSIAREMSSALFRDSTLSRPVARGSSRLRSMSHRHNEPRASTSG